MIQCFCPLPEDLKPEPCEVKGCKKEGMAHVHQEKSFWACRHHLRQVMRGRKLKLKHEAI